MPGLPSVSVNTLNRAMDTVRDWASGTAPGRRHWSDAEGRLHAEVRATGPDEYRRIVADLRSRPGVVWAAANQSLGRVVVAHDDAADPQEIVKAIDSAETDLGLSRRRFQHEDRPGDDEVLRRDVFALAADMAGLGPALLGRVFWPPVIPTEAAGAASFIDNQPRVRHALEGILGAGMTDTTLAAVNALSQALGQGPLGLVIDGAHRALRMSESAARGGAWRRQEAALAGEEETAGSSEAGRPAHPVRTGPVDTYLDRASAISVAGLAAGLATTSSPRRAANLMLAATPKAARLGREAFATTLGRTLGDRDVVVVDRSVLRRLDSVDAVVIDPSAVRTARFTLRDVTAVPGQDHDEVMTRCVALFDPAHPDRRQSSGGWSLGPHRSGSGEGGDRRAGVTGTRLTLKRGREVVGSAVVVPEEDPALDAVLAAARRSELVVVTARGSRGRLEPAADWGIEEPLTEAVRMLREDGSVVAVVSSDPVLLADADVGIGVVRAGRIPWTAHLLMHDVAHASLILDAVAMARTVSRRSVGLSVGGSGLAGVMAMTGMPGRSGARTMLAVNAAALAAQATGWWAGSELARRPIDPPVDRTPWHALPAGAVLQRLGSDRDGLSSDEARRRHRPAVPVDTAPVGLGRAVVDELSNPLTPVLAGGAALSAAVGSALDAAIVGSVGLLSAVVGGVQRLTTDRAVAALEQSVATSATVVRDGSTTTAAADSLVPGDVVELRSGDAVPADSRILKAAGLEVDESSLTGEAFPVRKNATPSGAVDVADRRSMLYEGTSIAAGTARAVVVATGTATEAGRSLAAGTSKRPTSTVDARLDQLTHVTLPVALGAGGAVVVNGLLRGGSMADTMGAGVSLAVAAVPEGLPFLITAAQLASARRLSERRALVKNPRTVEALGRANVLCFDKTGTLTEGRIRLGGVSDGVRTYAAAALEDWDKYILAVALRASPDTHDPSNAEHATDRAVLRGAHDAGVTADYGAGGWDLDQQLPFEPSRSYHASLGRVAGGHSEICVKGAPETILPLCDSWEDPSGTRPLTASRRRHLAAEVERLAEAGHRVLAVARREDDGTDGFGENDVGNLRFLGFLALSDPVRSSATAATARLQQAGVQLVMITGDHPSTAEAVAADLKLLNGRQVLTGADIDGMSPDELQAVVPEVAVFARVTPAHKVAIVAAFQRAGRIVAMTGDGANDAAAIRLADVGIALGRRGTAAARSAADLVVGDDRLETIVDALIEGRAMWGSVRDALSVLLGGNLGEIGFTLVSSLVTGRPALTTRQLLLVNLLTDLAPAMALAVRAPSDDTAALLDEGPDRSLGSSLTRDIAVRAVATAAGAAGAWGVASVSGRPVRARTVALVALVGTQLGQTLVAGRSSPAVVLTALGSAGVLAGVVQTPVLSRMFGCTPLGPAGWATAVTASVAATAAAVIAPGALGRLPVGGWRLPRLPLPALPSPAR